MTINQVIYNYVKNNSAMQTAYNKVFYLINDDKAKQPYAVLYLIDDPKEINDLCVNDQGQSRFQCDTFTRTFVKGIDKRQIFQDIFNDLIGQTIGGINIWKVEVMNIADRPDTINELFQFQFEVIISWTKK